jgi:hypothetical protein
MKFENRHGAPSYILFFTAIPYFCLYAVNYRCLLYCSRKEKRNEGIPLLNTEKKIFLIQNIETRLPNRDEDEQKLL